MKKEMMAAVLACALTLSGCGGAVGDAEKTSVDEIAGQSESMYASEQPPASSASVEELAEQARQAYERLEKEHYVDSSIGPWCPLREQALVQDMDGDGIPELILATFEMAESQWTDSIDYEGWQGPVYVYSVYTYGESGLQTLMLKWPTRALTAAGCRLCIGADLMDGQPVVVTLSIDAATGVKFGDEGYSEYIHVEALNPFTGQVLDEFDQEIQDSSTANCPVETLEEKVSHFTWLTLDGRGVLSLPLPRRAAQSAVLNGEPPTDPDNPQILIKIEAL